MKIRPEHYTIFSLAIEPLDTQERRERYRARDFPAANATRDLDKRYRWDLLWAAHTPQSDIRSAMIEVYNYANDEHIDTMLRKIVRPL